MQKKVTVKGNDYNVFIEYHKREGLWTGESYVEGHSVVDKSTKGIDDLLNKMEFSISQKIHLLNSEFGSSSN